MIRAANEIIAALGVACYDYNRTTATKSVLWSCGGSRLDVRGCDTGIGRAMFRCLPLLVGPLRRESDPCLPTSFTLLKRQGGTPETGGAPIFLDPPHTLRTQKSDS